VRPRTANLVWRLAGRVRQRLFVRTSPPLDALLDPGFVAIDLETTGLDARRDAIVAAAAIPFVGGRPHPGYSTLVNPGRPIPAASTRIHGIDDAHVAGAPSLHEVLPHLERACRDRVVVGHDVGFDLAFLDRARRARRGSRGAVVALDTRRLAVALHPSWRDGTELETLAERLGIPIVGRHTADGDARLAGTILVALLPALRAGGARTVSDLVWAQTVVARHR
jgi:DNA polymerase-3 subunit epsilon